MIKKYSEEKRLEVINARKVGANIAQISAQTGVGQTTVKAWLKDAGLTAKRKWESDEIQTILQIQFALSIRCLRETSKTICFINTMFARNFKDNLLQIIRCSYYSFKEK